MIANSDIDKLFGTYKMIPKHFIDDLIDKL